MARKVVVQRQRIGPQIRLLRQQHGLTLDDLAGQAGLSASHLSRLERSQTLPSFTVLAKIAQVLEVSIDDFVQLEQDLEKLDEQLAWQANILALNDDAYSEILGLSIDTRRQINRAVEALSTGQLSDTPVQEEAFELLSNGNLTEGWRKTRNLIQQRGMTGVGLARAIIQIRGIPGARSGIFMSHGVLPATPNIDLLTLYRSHFPSLPIDPSVVRRWRHWARTRVDDLTQYPPTHMIAHRDLFTRIAKRAGESDSPDCSREVADYWRRLHNEDPTFEVAMVDEDLITGNLLVAGGAGAVVEDHSHSHDDVDQRRAGVWISSRHLVEPIARSVADLWDSLPAENKDRERVGEWLAENAV
jgi:transcriptional regulator with XRE-family HTH domain